MQPHAKMQFLVFVNIQLAFVAFLLVVRPYIVGVLVSSLGWKLNYSGWMSELMHVSLGKVSGQRAGENKKRKEHAVRA